MTRTGCLFTAGLAPSERLVLSHQIGGGTERRPVIEPDPVRLNGRFQAYSYGALSVARVTIAPPHDEAWSISLHDPEHAFVRLQVAGTSTVVQDGKSVRLDPGALTVLVGARPYTVAIDDASRFVVLKLPLPRIAARVGDLDRLVATCTAGGDAALLAGFLHTLVAHEELGHRPGRDEAVGDVLLDLVAITYHAAPGPRAPRVTMGEHWQNTVRGFVDRHLDDPELGASLIARRLGVTPRYMQMVFASLGTTASAYISARRLELAATLLATEGQQVSEVAYRVGFTDLSHFYRSFRKRYGMSPKRYAAR